VARMVAPPQAQPAPPPPRRRPTHPDQALVLVVEDNLDNLRTVRALLSEHYRIVEAEDGQAAVELAQLHQPDLILTDLALPVMDGFAALAAIRQDPLLCDIPVVAVTATAMKGSREEILARGFDGYLSKPIDHDTLLKTLRGFLG
jgi:CheY-like chemotaxis protein